MGTKLLLIIVLLLVPLHTFGQEKQVVTVKVSCDGTTREETLQNCFSTAARQVYGAYVYEEQILEQGLLTRSDSLLVSKGFVQNYRIVEEISAPSKVTLHAEVSIALAPIRKLLLQQAHPTLDNRTDKINDIRHTQNKLKEATKYDQHLLEQQTQLLQALFGDPDKFLEQAYRFRLAGYAVEEVSAESIRGTLYLQIEQNTAFWQHYEDLLNSMETNGPDHIVEGILRSPAETWPEYTQKKVNHPLHRWRFSNAYGYPLTVGRLPGKGVPPYMRFILLFKDGQYGPPRWEVIFADDMSFPPEKVYQELNSIFRDYTVVNAPYPVSNSPFIKLGIVNGHQIPRELGPFLPQTVNVRVGNGYAETTFHIQKNAVLFNHRPGAVYYLLPYQACTRDFAIWNSAENLLVQYPGSLELGGLYTSYQPNYVPWTDNGQEIPDEQYFQKRWPLAVTKISFQVKIPFQVQDVEELESMLQEPLRVSGNFEDSQNIFSTPIMEVGPSMMVREPSQVCH